jgi:hypothetical protein
VETLDLAALELVAGAEVYLHAEATDGRSPGPQRTRSATHRIVVAGERRTTADLGSGVLLRPPPEAFRSQRQIIIDTEALVAARRRLGAGDFGEASRRLALDQRSLRLRYGTLLGDEFEDGAALAPGSGESGHGEDEAAGAPLESAPTAAPPLPAGLVHQHDSAEASTFFPSRVRSRLKSAVAQMWEAEKHLHTGDPERALPYEYAALAHLKAAQEAERVYVAKSGVEPPPLDPSRRLTGDLAAVASRGRRLETPPRLPDPVEEALIAVRRRRERQPLAAATAARETAALDAAGRLLARRALSDEAADLSALATLLELAAQPAALPDEAELVALESELWRLLPPPPPLPAAPAPGRGALDQDYRARLAGGARSEDPRP